MEILDIFFIQSVEYQFGDDDDDEIIFPPIMHHVTEKSGLNAIPLLWR